MSNYRDFVPGGIPNNVPVPYVGSTGNFDGTGLGLPGTEAAGYALCNGNNGTIDMRGSFMVGYDPADPDYNAVGAAGGQKNMPQHAHAGTGLSVSGSVDSAPDHTHGYAGLTGTQDGDGNEQTHTGTGDRQTSPGGAHGHTLSGATISGNTANAGSGVTADDNRPPYYTAAWMQRV